MCGGGSAAACFYLIFFGRGVKIEWSVERRRRTAGVEEP
jgi:hypothetical protein